jgi:hypothetical protein
MLPLHLISHSSVLQLFFFRPHVILKTFPDSSNTVDRQVMEVAWHLVLNPRKFTPF